MTNHHDDIIREQREMQAELRGIRAELSRNPRTGPLAEAVADRDILSELDRVKAEIAGQFPISDPLADRARLLSGYADLLASFAIRLSRFERTPPASRQPEGS